MMQIRFRRVQESCSDRPKCLRDAGSLCSEKLSHRQTLTCKSKGMLSVVWQQQVLMKHNELVSVIEMGPSALRLSLRLDLLNEPPPPYAPARLPPTALGGEEARIGSLRRLTHRRERARVIEAFRAAMTDRRE